MGKRPIARVVDHRLVRGVAGQPDIYVVTVECPHCGRRHRHGWAGGGTRAPHCAGNVYRADYRLVWDDPPADASEPGR